MTRARSFQQDNWPWDHPSVGRGRTLPERRHRTQCAGGKNLGVGGIVIGGCRGGCLVQSQPPPPADPVEEDGDHQVDHRETPEMRAEVVAFLAKWL